MGLVHSGIVGQYVLPSIQAATKSLDIVSPYLSPEYARLLTSLAEQGIIVRLITSDSNGQRHQQALRMLGQRTGAHVLGPRFWRYLILAFILGISGVMLGSPQGLVLIVIAGMVIVAALTKNLTRKKVGTIPLFMKVVPAAQLVHVKLYIVDQNVALVGSANLTYYGMNRNIERIEVKTTPSEVQPEIGVFASLWGPQPVHFINSTKPFWVPPPGQHSQGSTTDGVLTREEAATLDKLYGKKKHP